MPPKGTETLANGRKKLRKGEVAKLRDQGLPCPQCNQHHTFKTGRPKCVGHNAAGGPCGLPPIEGGTVCARRHGGARKATADAARRRVAWEKAEGEIAKLLQDADLPDQHPVDGLLEVVRYSGAMMRMLGYLVSGLDQDPQEAWHTEYGPGESSKEVRYSLNEAIVGFNHEGDQAADVRVLLLEKWTTLYMRACKTALDADIDERMVRDATATSDRFFTALNKAIAECGMTQDMQAAFVASLGNHLRSLSPLEERRVGKS